MAQINLLKTNTSSPGSFHAVNSALVKICAIGVLGVLGYYGYLFFQVTRVEKSIAALQQEVSTEKAQMAAIEGLDELSVRQGQLKEFSSLLDKHYYWSSFFPYLASSTLASTTYTSIRTLSDNSISLTLTVPSISELDRYLQIFNRKEINSYFQNVRIGGINRSFDNSSLSMKVDVRFDFNPELLKYREQYATTAAQVLTVPNTSINPSSTTTPRQNPR